MFLQDHDRARQQQLVSKIEEAKDVRLVYVGDLSYIDTLAIRNERPLCWVELISRNYDHATLMKWGGVLLKRATYDTLCRLAEVPLSVEWAGAVIVWDLTDGTYYRNVKDIPVVETIARDPRGAVNDTEPAILVKELLPL